MVEERKIVNPVPLSTGAAKETKLDVIKFKVKKFLIKNKPHMVIIGWYWLLSYLFFAFLFGDYGLKTILFSFSIYFIYDKLLGDVIDSIIEVKKRGNQ